MDPNSAQPVPIDDEVEDVVVPDESTPDKEEIDLDEEDKNTDDFKNLDSKAFAAMRKEATEAKRERDELRKRLQDNESRVNSTPPPTPPVADNRRREFIGGVPVPETKAEWDQLARQDWQTAVDMRSIINARKVADEVRHVERTSRSLDEAKNKVLQKHPELADKNTEKGKIYLNILDRNPEYLTMPKGPIFAMRDMEEEMESLGYTKEQIFDSKKAAAHTESTRVNRASLTQGGRMPEKQGRTVTLSKDDLEFCKSQGIDPKDYAKEKLNLETNRRSQL